jgi:hypothetical protein
VRLLTDRAHRGSPRSDQEEAVRLAYVAATRARDLLVAPVCGDGPLGGWLEVLDAGLYPPESAKRQSDRVLGAPAFWEESVLDRGPKGKAPATGSVRPGLHKPRLGDHRVAWWDSGVLASRRAEANGRLVNATREEIDTAVTTVNEALKHPLMRRATTALSLRRETPVQHQIKEGPLVEGVLDLAFQEDTPEFKGWTVVDFKTEEIEIAKEQYLAQAASYVEAVRTTNRAGG